MLGKPPIFCTDTDRDVSVPYRRGEGGVEDDVSQDVDHRQDDAGDSDGPQQVLHRVLPLLDDNVEVSPE